MEQFDNLELAALSTSEITRIIDREVKKSKPNVFSSEDKAAD